MGIGVQGLADTFAKMRIPFTSEKAKQVNKDIFETIYHGALTASHLIAKERKEKFGLTGLEIPGMKSGGLMNLTRTTPPKRSLNKDSQGLASLPEYDR